MYMSAAGFMLRGALKLSGDLQVWVHGDELEELLESSCCLI